MSHRLLILVRHAKSSWKDERLPDHDRPLNARGQRDAPMMGQRMAEAGIRPQKIVSSSAVRAQCTAQLIAEQFSAAPAVQVEPEYYGASAAELLEKLSEVERTVTICLAVGHNPAITELAHYYSDIAIENIPTCGILFVQVHEWNQLSAGRLLMLDFPKNSPPADLTQLLSS